MSTPHPSVGPVSSASRFEKLIAASRLFSGLSATVIADLARQATPRRLLKGDRLWRAGDAATHFTLILSGIFKIVRTAPDGSESIVALFGPRESIGDVAVVSRRPYPAAAVVASDQAEVMRIPAEQVLAAMEVRADVAGTINRTLIDHTQALQEKIRVMSAGSVPKRLATLLLGLAERFGDETEEDTVMLPIALSRSELACLIGARVETTIRTIRAWEKAGIVETLADGFRIKNLEALVQKTRAESAAGEE